MKKSDLINAIAQQADISRKDAEKALNATIDTIINAVAEGDKIQLTPSKLLLPRFLLLRPARHLRIS